MGVAEFYLKIFVGMLVWGIFLKAQRDMNYIKIVLYLEYMTVMCKSM